MTAKANALVDNFRFLRGAIARPKNVGAIMPSGPHLSRAMAQQIDLNAGGNVVELGPGTGSITEAILAHGVTPANLTLIEYDLEFAQHLAARFAGVRVINGDAFDLTRTLGPKLTESKLSAIVSGIPLLNFAPEVRRRLIDESLSLLAPGAPFIQFSYGLHSPAVPPSNFTVTRAALVWRNIPPARVWVYRRA